MIKSPRISVVVPTFNRGIAALDTIDSALSQDMARGEVEFLLVDDGSTDDTFAILQNAYGHDTRVRLFGLSHGGVARARNFGLQQARGEFIAFLDHDDYWKPSKLRLQLEAFRNRPDVGVIYCFWREEDADGRELPPLPVFLNSEHRRPPHGWVQPRLLLGNFLISMTIPLVRTRFLRQVGGFDTRMVPCDDWDIWVRMAGVCRFELVPEVLAHYRRYQHQQSANRPQMIDAGRHVRLKHWRLYACFLIRTPRPPVRFYAKRLFNKIRTGSVK